MASLDDSSEPFRDCLDYIVGYPRAIVNGLLYAKLEMTSSSPELFRDWAREMP